MKKDVVIKAKKGLLSVIFSRTTAFVLVMLLQIGIVIATLTILNRYVLHMYLLFQFLGMIAVVYIVNNRDNPAFKLAWILLIFIIPVMGTAFYIFSKFQIKSKRIAGNLRKTQLDSQRYMMSQERSLEKLGYSGRDTYVNLAQYLQKEKFPVHVNTDVVYFKSGEEKFAAMKKELSAAKEYIFMEYFIIAKGQMLDELLEILEKKAKEGVKVFLMYDGLGALPLIPYGYAKELEKRGIRCKAFNPIKPIFSTYQNNRDHRKICVVDGKVGFTGGINLADEYINVKKRFGHWKDTAVLLRGEAVQSLSILFLQMWNMDEHTKEKYENYLTPKQKLIAGQKGFIIPYGDSPFDKENIGEQVYFHILNHAKKYVHIMTPYLILDNETIINLTYAAKCGIEIIIIMPHIPDKWYAYAVAKTYYRTLMDAGVQIYEYTPGFVHAKMFVADDDTATVGTVNLDYRSLYLHFECGAFIYRNPVVKEIEADFQDTLKKSRRVTYADLKKGNLVMKVVGRVLRLFAPLM